MKNIIVNISVWALFITIASGQSRQVEVRRFSQDFALQNTISPSGQMFHVFTKNEQMIDFFKPVIINETNAVPLISNKDFVNQFVVAISGSKSSRTKPIITTIQPKNKTLYVYYEEVKSLDADKSAVVAVSKGDFKEVVFVDRVANTQKRIYYNDVPPVIAKIVLSYLDMPQSAAYKYEYQVSIDETGEVIYVKDENGEITNRLDFTVSSRVFEELRANTISLEKGGEKIDRNLPNGKNYREILLLDDSNRVIYSLTWDNLNKVNESTQQFVRAIESLVPEKAISFNKRIVREVARN